MGGAPQMRPGTSSGDAGPWVVRRTFLRSRPGKREKEFGSLRMQEIKVVSRNVELREEERRIRPSSRNGE